MYASVPSEDWVRTVRGVLPAAVDGTTRKLDGHDLIIVIGAPVFRYHEYDPGRYLPDGAELLHLTCAIPARPPARQWAAPAPPVDGVLALGAVFGAINAHAPHGAVYVNEATSTVSEVWNRIDFDFPGSYYFRASGGLGFRLLAAVGVRLAGPGRRVIGLVGDGSANFGLTALWPAA